MVNKELSAHTKLVYHISVYVKIFLVYYTTLVQLFESHMRQFLNTWYLQNR